MLQSATRHEVQRLGQLREGEVDVSTPHTRPVQGREATEAAATTLVTDAGHVRGRGGGRDVAPGVSDASMIVREQLRTGSTCARACASTHRALSQASAQRPRRRLQEQRARARVAGETGRRWP
jgi:hypothetical protein